MERIHFKMIVLRKNKYLKWQSISISASFLFVSHCYLADWKTIQILKYHGTKFVINLFCNYQLKINYYFSEIFNVLPEGSAFKNTPVHIKFPLSESKLKERYIQAEITG